MSEKQSQSNDVHEILNKYWGYPRFRPLQEDIIHSILNGQDTLALLPTGGGKSLCYQVPALAMDGICIVVSPLIALIQDQVNQLRKRDIKALMLHSGMSQESIDITLDNAIYGEYKFLYVAPERLKSKLFIERLVQMNVSFVAIDEAHCISQWGHDFRPAYKDIASLRDYLPHVSFLALTATATPQVKEEIQNLLGFNGSNVIQGSYHRANLAYHVHCTENKQSILENLIKPNECTIIYTRSRKLCEDLSAQLNRAGIGACYYHAGLSHEERERIQEEWIDDKHPVIIATNAFGMGIDKANVRHVIHIMAPDSLEAYVQEAGRAGRDLLPADASLIVSPTEGEELLSRIKKLQPVREEIKRVYLALANKYRLPIGYGKDSQYHFKLLETAQRIKMPAQKVLHALKVLESNDYIHLSDAVYRPSEVMFITDGTALYNFELKNEKYVPLIKLILRSKTGTYDRFVAIDENRISKILNISVSQVERQLEELDRYEILRYRPKSELPILSFKQDRVNEDYLRISTESLEEYYKRINDRMRGLRSYFESNECRSVSILRYFGEEGSKCGICDVCSGKSNIQASKPETLEAQIKWVLEQRAITMQSLIKEIGSDKASDVMRYVRKSIDEKTITLGKGMILILNDRSTS